MSESDEKKVQVLNGIRRKLKSETGASITFALLLFLVCAVVGAAVLVAGTTASGRMSKIAENDQRYYAVNSAARFLVDTIQEKRLEVKKIETADTDGTDVETEYLVDDNPFSDDAITSIPVEAAYWLGYLRETPLSGPKDLKLKLATTDSDYKDSIEVSIEETINTDGSLKFEIRNSGDQTDGQYGLRLVFELENQTSDVLDLQNQKKTTENDLKWKLSDIQTIENAAPASIGA